MCVSLLACRDGKGLDQKALQDLCAEMSGELSGLSEAALLMAALDADVDGRVTQRDVQRVRGGDGEGGGQRVAALH